MEQSLRAACCRAAFSEHALHFGQLQHHPTFLNELCLLLFLCFLLLFITSRRLVSKIEVHNSSDSTV